MEPPDERRVRHTARLARLRLDGEELAELARDCATILDAFRSLQEVELAHGEDALGVERPDARADRDGALREDVARPGLDRAELLARAPETADGFFRVPRVIERDAPEAGE